MPWKSDTVITNPASIVNDDALREMGRRVNAANSTHGRTVSVEVAPGASASINHGISGKPHGVHVAECTGSLGDISGMAYDEHHINFTNAGSSTITVKFWVY